MGLNQLQYGGSVSPINQTRNNQIDYFEEGRKQKESWNKSQAEEIMLNTLHGTAPKQGFLSRMLNQNAPQNEFKQPEQRWDEVGVAPQGTAPVDINLNSDPFTRFNKKFNMEGMRSNMLSQADGFGQGGVRTQLTKMLHDKLPDAIMKQQKMDSLNMLSTMAEDAQAQWGEDNWEDKLSEKIKKSPEAKQWFDNYINTYKDEDEVPDLVDKMMNKLGMLNGLGTTESDMLTKSILKRVRQTEGMKNKTDKEMGPVRTQFESIKKQVEGQGYKVEIGPGGDIEANHPQSGVSYTLRWNEHQNKFVIDRYGEGWSNRLQRWAGVDAGVAPSNLVDTNYQTRR